MRAVVAAAVLVSLFASGCFGGNTPGSDGDAALPSEPEGLSFVGPTLAGVGGRSALGEASIAAGPNGVLLTCALDTSMVYASLDGGRTWNATDPFDGSWNGDCDVAVAGDGTWVVVFSKPSEYYDLPTAPTVSDVATSRDQGDTWTTQTATRSPTQCPHTYRSSVTCVLHRPWLYTEGDRVDLTYFGMGPTVVLFQRSTDAASRWSDPAVVAADPGFGATGRMVESADGQRVLVPLLHAEPSPTEGPDVHTDDLIRFAVAESTDGGMTWTERAVADAVVDDVPLRYGMPSLAERDGTLYFAAGIKNGTLADAVIFTSRDGGDSWSPPHVIAGGLDFGGDGQAHTKVLIDDGPRGLVAAWYHRDPVSGWVADVAGLGSGASPEVLWRTASPPLGGEDVSLEFFGLTHDENGTLHFMLPVPEERCADDGPHCLWHVALTPP